LSIKHTVWLLKFIETREFQHRSSNFQATHFAMRVLIIAEKRTYAALHLVVFSCNANLLTLCM
jgi:hypothetical protein